MTHNRSMWINYCSEVFMVALLVWRTLSGKVQTSAEREIAAEIAKTIVRRKIIDSAEWGHTIMEILTMPLQYSVLTERASSWVTMWPLDENLNFKAAKQIADDVLFGRVAPSFADSYYNKQSIIKPPAFQIEVIREIGDWVFYRYIQN